MYSLRAASTIGRLEGWDGGGRRLCFLSASRRTPRQVVADRGRDGWVLLLKKSVKDTLEVVGRANGKGMADEREGCDCSDASGDPQKMLFTRLGFPSLWETNAFSYG